MFFVAGAEPTDIRNSRVGFGQDRIIEKREMEAIWIDDLYEVSALPLVLQPSLPAAAAGVAAVRCRFPSRQRRKQKHLQPRQPLQKADRHHLRF